MLLERLLAHQPHPFGVRIVMAELMRNPEYKFADMAFVKCDPMKG